MASLDLYASNFVPFSCQQPTTFTAGAGSPVSIPSPGAGPAAEMDSPSSRLRGVGRPTGGLNAELLCVLGVQSPPAAELHGLDAGDAADGSSAEKVIQNIETNVPPGSTHGDEGAVD